MSTNVAEVTAPSAGAASNTGNGGSGAASPTASAPSLSDDQILGIESDSGADQPAQPDANAPAEDAGAQPGATDDTEQPAQQETVQEDQPDQATQADTASPFSLEEALKANPQLKEWMKQDPTVRRAMYGYESVVNAFGSPKDAHAVAETVKELGGKAELDAILEGDAKLEALISTDDPASREEALGTLYRSQPEEIGRLLADAPRIYSQLDPAGWMQNVATPIVSSVLEGHRKQVLAAKAQAEAKGDAETAGYFDGLLGFLDEQAKDSLGIVPWEKAAPSGQDPHVLEGRKQLDADRQTFYREQYETSANDLREQVTTGLRDAISKELAKKVPALKGEQLAGAVEQVFLNVDSMRNRDDALMRSAESIFKSLENKTFDHKRNTQLAQKRVAEVSKLIGKAIETALGIRAAAARTEISDRKQKQENAASRVDITSGAAPTVKPVRKSTPDDLKKNRTYDRMSDDDILNS